jgi:hypothetical protein
MSNLDRVEECLDNLRTNIIIGLHPLEATLGPTGLKSQMDVVKNVKEDFKKLEEAIAAMRGKEDR